MANPPPAACGLDTVEISRMERLLREAPESVARLFSEEELREVGEGPGRAASLAARFAAKEACCKLFPRETSLGLIEPMDFSVGSDAYGAPSVLLSAAAQAALDRRRLEGIRLSLTHTGDTASAIAWADPKRTDVPWYGRFIYHVLPLRRGVVMENLRRVFADYVPEAEIRRLAQAYYAHFVRFFLEFVRLPFMSASQRQQWIRIENIESVKKAHTRGKGILLMTGHFGNWEVATVAGISQLKQYHGLLHFVRRPIKPKFLNDFITHRFERAGFGTLTRQGSLDAMLDILATGAIVVYIFDQHAGRKKGIPMDFFGRPADTFKSLAILAMSTGAPVIPASSWREPDGSHVLRFEDPLPHIDLDDVGESIRRNTRAYNVALERMLLRHPEQWIWMHRRWKLDR